MKSMDWGLRRLATILAAYLDGKMTNETAGNAAVRELADMEEDLQRRPHEYSKGQLFLRAFWAAEQLREPLQHRTHVDEVRYLLSCIKGETEYDEERANAFYRSRER